MTNQQDVVLRWVNESFPKFKGFQGIHFERTRGKEPPVGRRSLWRLNDPSSFEGLCRCDPDSSSGVLSRSFHGITSRLGPTFGLLRSFTRTHTIFTRTKTMANNKPSCPVTPSLEELLSATFRHRLDTHNNDASLAPRYSSFARQTSQRQIISILQEALDLSELMLRRGGTTSEREREDDGSDDDPEFSSDYRHHRDRPHEED